MFRSPGALMFRSRATFNQYFRVSDMKHWAAHNDMAFVLAVLGVAFSQSTKNGFEKLTPD